MKKCKIDGCDKPTRHFFGTSIGANYCEMHLARMIRHGTFELKKETGNHGLEKISHDADQFIKDNWKKQDVEILKSLIDLGFTDATRWAVRYRRRKLGLKKYDGSKSKERAKRTAVMSYGNKCEICNYGLAVEAHHIIPKKQGINNALENLCVVCPNCHSLITKRKLTLKSREGLEQAKKEREILLSV